MIRTAVIILLICLQSTASAALITSLALDATDVPTAGSPGQEPEPPATVEEAFAALWADPAFVEQQRALAQQSAAQLEALVAAIRITDAHFNCENAPEQPHCVQQTNEQVIEEDSGLQWLSESVDNHEQAYFPLFSAPTRVPEPTLLALLLCLSTALLYQRVRGSGKLQRVLRI